MTNDKIKPNQCPQCRGRLIEVNGLYYKCENGHIDDSTFYMITAEVNGFSKV